MHLALRSILFTLYSVCFTVKFYSVSYKRLHICFAIESTQILHYVTQLYTYKELYKSVWNVHYMYIVQFTKYKCTCRHKVLYKSV